ISVVFHDVPYMEHRSTNGMRVCHRCTLGAKKASLRRRGAFGQFARAPAGRVGTEAPHAPCSNPRDASATLATGNRSSSAMRSDERRGKATVAGTEEAKDLPRKEVVGLIPAAGRASRLAPLPCSKELLPV